MHIKSHIVASELRGLLDSSAPPTGTRDWGDVISRSIDFVENLEELIDAKIEEALKGLQDNGYIPI